MRDVKRLFAKYRVILLFAVFLMIITFYTIYYQRDKAKRTEAEKTGSEDVKRWERGYDLPVDDRQRKEAETDCIETMNSVSDIYNCAEKGEDSNVVLSDEVLEQMQNVISKSGCPIVTSEKYGIMQNYKKMDRFLQNCMEGKENSIVLYSLSGSGGVTRKEYDFDGADMYLFTASAVWDDSCDPSVSYISYARIEKWDYTEKGWFSYELCVPEPPEVTEIIDGCELIRVIPLSEKCRAFSEKCLGSLCYKGNNLLCSNWDTETLSTLDYNAAYEYLYSMKYKEHMDPDQYKEGIPAEEFEGVIMEYLPVTAEELREWAVYNETEQNYAWARLGGGNYIPSYLGTAVPEVVNVSENGDGTVTLTVDAVCGMVSADDAVITHELTVFIDSDGSFRYLGNKILSDGTGNIPEYRYRIAR